MAAFYKTLLFDFDGVFSDAMIYGHRGKAGKMFDFGIRHSFELLHTAGFDKINIITGDSSAKGRLMSRKFVSSFPNKITFHEVDNRDKISFIIKNFDLLDTVYICDDIYDVILSPYMDVYTIRRKYTDTLVSISNNKIRVFEDWMALTQHLISWHTPYAYDSVLHKASGISLAEAIQLRVHNLKKRGVSPSINVIRANKGDENSTEIATNVYAVLNTQLSEHTVRYEPKPDVTRNTDITVCVGANLEKDTLSSLSKEVMFFGAHTEKSSLDLVCKEISCMLSSHVSPAIPLVWVIDDNAAKRYADSIQLMIDNSARVEFMAKAFR